MEKTKIILSSQFTYLIKVLKNQVNTRDLICQLIKKNLQAAPISNLLIQIDVDMTPQKANGNTI